MKESKGGALPGTSKFGGLASYPGVGPSIVGPHISSTSGTTQILPKPTSSQQKISLPTLKELLIYRLLNRCPAGFRTFGLRCMKNRCFCNNGTPKKNCKFDKQMSCESCYQNYVFNQGKCEKPNISWNDLKQVFGIDTEFKAGYRMYRIKFPISL